MVTHVCPEQGPRQRAQTPTQPLAHVRHLVYGGGSLQAACAHLYEPQPGFIQGQEVAGRGTSL